MTLLTALTDLADLVLPAACVGCGKHLGPLCCACAPRQNVVTVEPAVRAAGSYDGALRKALLAYKERDRRDLAAPLAELLVPVVLAVAAAGARAGPAPPASLVCIPSSPAAAAARGGDHVLRLARRVSRATGLPVSRGVLALTRSVRDSAGLAVSERAANLGGAMRARPAPDGCAALVLDDIVTTGATLAEARRALAAAGWPVAGCAVIAATVRRDLAGRDRPTEIDPQRWTHRAPIGSPQLHGLA